MIRIGYGSDLHQLVINRALIIGGVNIPFEKGLLGHSDGDILIHAIIDAFLGAASLGDIGHHFCDTKIEHKDLDSRIMLKEVYKKVYNLGYTINNIDSTIEIEQPKLKPYINLMKQNIANDLNITIDQISIKAKTNEKIGIIGEGRAAKATAVILLT